MRRFDVWNLGLPRTGTTSVVAALESMGLKCKAMVAQHVGQEMEKYYENHSLPPTWPPYVICTTRDYGTWVQSCLKYFPRATETQLEEVFQRHQMFIEKIQGQRSIGIFDVNDGMPGLFRAMSRGVTGKTPLPHLHKS